MPSGRKARENIEYVGLIWSDITTKISNLVACGIDRCGAFLHAWTFWKYERALGDWVPLEELRR
jgi:hypothetical protein